MGGRAKAAVQEAKAMTALSFAEAVSIMKDNDAVQAFFAKLEALKVEITREVDKTLTIEQIDRLLIQTRNDRNMAAEELAGAKAKAAEMLAEADAKAKRKGELRERRVAKGEASLAEAQKRLAGETSEFKRALATWNDRQLKREAAARDLERASKTAKAEAEAMKARHEKALASMKADVAAA